MRTARRLAVAALLLGSCQSTPKVVPSRNFDRPQDMSFVCMGLFETRPGGADAPAEWRVSGQPMQACHPANATQPDPSTIDADGNRILTRRTFAFVTNTARGELSVIDMDQGALLDLDPGNPGFNTAPVGVLPEDMGASDDGCRLVTANRGSCDLSFVDPGALMSSRLAAEREAQTGEPFEAPPLPAGISRTVVVRSASGAPLRVAPGEIELLPQDTSPLAPAEGLVPPAQLCGIDTTIAPPIGWGTAPPGGMPWKAVVTFPACDLVALIDLPSGTIVDSVKVHADGSASRAEGDGREPVCPAECGTTQAPPDDAGSSDAGSSSDAGTNGDASEAGAGDAGTGGGAPPSGAATRLGAGPLAIRPDGSRIYVGLANSDAIASIPVGPSGFGGATGIPLHEGADGVTRLQLSVDPWLPTGEPGRRGAFVSEGGANQERQYLYAIARDGSIRVVHVSPNSPEQECEMNVDPLNPLTPRESWVNRACFPVADPTVRRRPLANGPGIRLPGTIARDLAFADLHAPTPNPDELALDGAVGFVVAASGATYVVNISTTPREITGVVAAGSGVLTGAAIVEPPALPGGLRNGAFVTYESGLGSTFGLPRLEMDPSQPSQGPHLEPFTALVTAENARILAAGGMTTYVLFPDPGAVTPQVWQVVWEGELAGTRPSGRVAGPFPSVPGRPATDSILRDDARPFCGMGALGASARGELQGGDIVTMYGCEVDSQCGLGQVCVRSPSAPSSVGGLSVRGLCMDQDETLRQARTELCRDFLTTVRRYEIIKATPGAIRVRPRIDEIPRATPCTTNDDCRIADGDTARDGFECLALDGGTTKHCVDPCTVGAGDGDCRPGQICVQFGTDPSSGLCAGGPPLDQRCFPELTYYTVQAGRSYLVRGSAVGAFRDEIIAVPDPLPDQMNSGEPLVCAANPPGGRPEQDTRLVSRIPLLDWSDPAARCVQQPANVPAGEPGSEFTAPLAPEPEKLVDYLRRMAARTPYVGPDSGPNPCLFMYVPELGSTDNHINVRLLFRNPEIQFVLNPFDFSTAPLASYPGDVSAMSFEVRGGFRPQIVAIPDTIELGMPIRILTGPVEVPLPEGGDVSQFREIPYLYVVDQRRIGRTTAVGGSTRGQIVRMHPKGYLENRAPIYETFRASGSTFPIQ